MKGSLLIYIFACSVIASPVSVHSSDAERSASMVNNARIAEFLATGDVRYDESAKNGAPAMPLYAPDQYQAGELVTFLVVVTTVGKAYVTYQAFMAKAQTADNLLKTGNYVLDADSPEAIEIRKVGQLLFYGETSDDPVTFRQSFIRTLESNLLPKDPRVLLSVWDESNTLGGSIIEGLAADAGSFDDTFGGLHAGSTPISTVFFGEGDFTLGTNPFTSSNVFTLNPTSGFLGDSSGGVASELVHGGTLAAASDVFHWPVREGAIAGLTNFGPIDRPSNSAGGRFGLIHTGLGAASDQGLLEQTITAPRTASATFTARFNFVTTEFPEFLGSEFNDSYVIEMVHLQTGATKELARFEGSLNQIFSESDKSTWRHVQFQSGTLPYEVLDQAASGAGQTGWQNVSSSGINLQQGQNYLIRFRVNDVGDKVWDSALLIDRASLR